MSSVRVPSLEETSILDCTSANSTISPESAGSPWGFQKEEFEQEKKKDSEIKYLKFQLAIFQKEADICRSMIHDRDKILQKRDTELLQARETIENLLSRAASLVQSATFHKQNGCIECNSGLSLEDFQNALQMAFKRVVVCEQCKVKHRQLSESLFSAGKRDGADYSPRLVQQKHFTKPRRTTGMYSSLEKNGV
jgi:hypothetical protein